MRHNPSPKRDRDKHRQEALRFCSALLDSGATPERVRELCLDLYGVSVAVPDIVEFGEVVRKFAKFRTDDSLVAL